MPDSPSRALPEVADLGAPAPTRDARAMPCGLQSRALMRDLLAVGARLGAVRDGLAARLGLPGAAFSVLTALAALEAQGASPGIVMLAQHLGLSPTFVTAEVARLERCQLVEKTPHPRDRRRIVLRLSGRGSAALAALAPAEAPVHAALFAGLDAAAIALLAAMLRNLLADAEHALALLAGAPAAA